MQNGCSDCQRKCIQSAVRGIERKGRTKKIYKLANVRKRMAKDIGRVTAVQDQGGTLLTEEEEVKDRWIGHSDDLLDVENER